MAVHGLQDRKPLVAWPMTTSAADGGELQMMSLVASSEPGHFVD
jgi:hypothetical protein